MHDSKAPSCRKNACRWFAHALQSASSWDFARAADHHHTSEKRKTAVCSDLDGLEYCSEKPVDPNSPAYEG